MSMLQNLWLKNKISWYVVIVVVDICYFLGFVFVLLGFLFSFRTHHHQVCGILWRFWHSLNWSVSQKFVKHTHSFFFVNDFRRYWKLSNLTVRRRPNKKKSSKTRGEKKTESFIKYVWRVYLTICIFSWVLVVFCVRQSFVRIHWHWYNRTYS